MLGVSTSGYYAWRRRVTSTRLDPPATVAADQVRREFHAEEPNRLWVADITYVPTAEGVVYLATVLDVFSRKVVGWAMSARQTAALVSSALGYRSPAEFERRWHEQREPVRL